MANLYAFPGWGSTVTIRRDPAPWISGGPAGYEGELTFQIKPLGAIPAFLAFVKGSLETLPLAGGGTISRKVPLLHPDDPNMYIDSYHLEYFGSPRAELWEPGKSIHTEQFSHARMTARFISFPEGVGSGQQFYTLSYDVGATVDTMPDGAMVTASGKALTGERGITYPTLAVVVTTYMSPTPVSWTLAQLVGRVNSAVFEGYPEGVLRFDALRMEVAGGSAGEQVTKSFAFKVREEPWNKVLNNDGQWEYAFSKVGGFTKYKGADLNMLKTY